MAAAFREVNDELVDNLISVSVLFRRIEKVVAFFVLVLKFVILDEMIIGVFIQISL